MKTKSFLVSGLAMLLIVATVTPVVAAAQTVNYQPRTQAEIIAYLYGRISQLMEIRVMLERSTTQNYNQSTIRGSFDSVVIDTHSAQSVTDSSAVLRGEIVLYGNATAKAWFEYGQDDDFLDQKTRQATIRTAYDRALRQEVTRLEEDERYFFRVVAQTLDGSVIYGPVYGFRTDEVD